MNPASPATRAPAQRLEATLCKACAHLFLPKGPVCPRCWSGDLATRALSGRGSVATFTVYRQQYDPGFVPPYVIALVALAEGPRMISNVVGCAPESVHVGMPVRGRFERRGERMLALFEPDDADPDKGVASQGEPP